MKHKIIKSYLYFMFLVLYIHPKSIVKSILTFWMYIKNIKHEIKK